jgi:hypothetical protein
MDCEIKRTDIGTVFNVSLIFLIFISYLPQYIQIIKTKDVTGISNITVFLGNTLAWMNAVGCALINWNYFECCNVISLWDCNKLIIPVYQIGASSIAWFIFYLLFIKYNTIPNKKEVYIPFGIYITSILSVLLVYISYYEFQIMYNTILWGNVFNSIAAGMTLLLWTPQIYTLVKTKKTNISLIMLALQGPSSIFFFILEYIINKQAVSVALVYLLCGIQQIILFILSVHYKKETKLGVYHEMNGL